MINVQRPPALVMEHEAAAYLGVSVTTLRRDRGRPNRSIPLVNIGATVRYSLSALDAWIERTANSTTASAPAIQPPAPVTNGKRGRGRPRKTQQKA